MIGLVLLGSCVLWMATAQGAQAQTAEPESDPPAVGGPETGPAPRPGAGAPALGLDSLLRPRGAPVAPRSELRGGRDRAQWEEAFTSARREVAELEARVAEVQEQVRSAAGGDWNYTPMGGGVPTDPEVLKLRAQLKRDRQSLEAAQGRLRDLEVEASLASVPDSWRGLPPEAE